MGDSTEDKEQWLEDLKQVLWKEYGFSPTDLVFKKMMSDIKLYTTAHLTAEKQESYRQGWQSASGEANAHHVEVEKLRAQIKEHELSLGNFVSKERRYYQDPVKFHKDRIKDLSQQLEAVEK